MMSCKECKRKCLVEDLKEGTVVCTACGIVQNQMSSVYDGPDWSNYEDARSRGKDNSRVGWMDPCNPWSTLGSSVPKGTWIDAKNKHGKPIKLDLHKLGLIVMSDSKEKSFYETSKVFDDYVIRGELSGCVADRAKMYWAEIMRENKIFRGANRKGMIACCIMHASKHYNVFLSRDELSSKLDIRKTDILQGEPIFRNIMQKKLKLDARHRSEDLFVTIVQKLNAPFYLVKECAELYETLRDDLSVVSTKSAIAGVTWHVVSAHAKLGKREVARCAGVTVPTLTNAHKIILKQAPLTLQSLHEER